MMFVDTETFSTEDIKKVGTVKYAASAEVMLAGFKLGNDYSVWDFTEEVIGGPKVEGWVVDYILGGGEICAHNALFDYLILKKLVPGIQLHQMVDSMAICAAAGLPLSLAKAGEAIDLSPDKQKLKDGTRLVTKFCKPRKPSKHNPSPRNWGHAHPLDWITFRDEYLRLDIESMEAIVMYLPPLSAQEQDVWYKTQQINLDGVPIDADTTDLIVNRLDTLVDEESSQFIRLAGVFPTQRDKVLAWVKSHGVKVEDLQAATVEELIKDPKTPDIVRTALEHRANTSHMSFKKFKTIQNAHLNGNVYGTLMYHASHTGRFGGRLLQTQNLTKGNVDGNEAVQRVKDGEFTVELVKSCVRPMIYCPEGFTIYDYSSVEARGLQWLVEDAEALSVFTSGQDPYIWMASKIYKVGYEKVTPKQRFTGKQAILGLGYQMGAVKFISMVEGYGETISKEEASLAVSVYRKVHTKAVEFWKKIEMGAIRALQHKGSSIRVNSKIRFICLNDTLYMVLPSSRRIAYPSPLLEQSSYGYKVTYMSMNAQQQWVRTTTYGGKLTENAVQGLCRDILVDAVNGLLFNDFNVVTHIHDEIIVRGMDRSSLMEDIMLRVPEWANGLPIEVEGFTSQRFIKG